MIPLILIFVLAYLYWMARKCVRLSRESTSWPTAPGAVTLSERVKRGWRTQPHVRFAYQVDGRDYTGEKVTFAAGVPVKETDAILAKYPVGAPVTVSYSRADPAMAILEPGPNRWVSAAARAYLYWIVVIVGLNVLYYFVQKWGNEAGPAGTPSAPRTYDDVAAETNAGDKLIQDGADKGDAKDEGYVGAWYLGGLEGYPKDPVKAAEWLRKSAEGGDATSQSLLAELCAGGNGVPKDLNQAVSWFQKAADQGDPLGCAGVGRAYEKGWGGLPQDTQKAIEWYKKAGDNPIAKKALARLGAN